MDLYPEKQFRSRIVFFGSIRFTSRIFEPSNTTILVYNCKTKEEMENYRTDQWTEIAVQRTQLQLDSFSKAIPLHNNAFYF